MMRECCRVARLQYNARVEKIDKRAILCMAKSERKYGRFFTSRNKAKRSDYGGEEVWSD